MFFSLLKKSYNCFQKLENCKRFLEAKIVSIRRDVTSLDERYNEGGKAHTVNERNMFVLI